MPENLRHCVIGAGYAGLGVAKAFVDRGIPIDIFERNDDVGGNWLNGVYDSTHIISSRDSTGYDDFPMPKRLPDFPRRTQVLDYLRSFVDEFDLRKHIRFRTEVVGVEPVDPAGLRGWRVQLSTGEVRSYAGAVVCNGHHWDKRYPRYPGFFGGKTIHSKDYKNPQDLQGERVLVVGAGNSGCDIAVEAAMNVSESYISMRRGYYFLPKTFLGIPMAEWDRPWIPVWAQRRLAKTAIRLTLGTNSRLGLPEPDHEIFDRHPIVNSELPYELRHGSVTAKPDVARFEGKTVLFVDGSSAEVDTIVYATGFKVSFPFLDEHMLEWENGVPKRVGGVFVPGMANIYIFGLLQPRGGAGPLISAGARFLARVVHAQRELAHPVGVEFARLRPPSARMLVGVSETMREIRMGERALRLLIAWGKRRDRRMGVGRPEFDAAA